MAERVADSKKITINLGHVDPGHIDLMVQEGFYSNRTDFIRTPSETSSNVTPMRPIRRSRERK
jgi:Ribbon-Helix-Helix transcriptional regulator family